MYSEGADKLRAKEFPTLKGTCYLDHTGTTLYAKSQILAASNDLCENIYGNPHSLSLSSRYCSDVIDQVRYRILQHFNTSPEEYTVVFTSGATGALKLVAECFDWEGNAASNSEGHRKASHHADPSKNHKKAQYRYNTSVSLDGNKVEIPMCDVNDEYILNTNSSEKKGDKSCGSLIYLQDNHTSVLGMRELAYNKGANIHCLPHDCAFKMFNSKETVPLNGSYTDHCHNSLFVYPAQCNFSGLKYPLCWISKVHNGVLDEITNVKDSIDKNRCDKWFCLLDAATFVSTNCLDLSFIKPDFVCISFYKMFGYPTGLGALLVRNSSADVLKKTYFGGGTVLISLSSERFHVSRPNLSDRFEDGTLPFLSIAALRHGFDTLQKLTGSMNNITLHTFSLARYVHHSLMLLHHSNGSPVAVLYSDTDYEDRETQGNIVNFNLLRSNKEFVGFMEVLNIANLYGIHLRTGCFCNPGACQRHLGLTIQELQKHFQAGHVCGDERDLVDGQPTGSIRISFGYMSSKDDADKFLDMITTCFVDGPKIMKVPEWWENFKKLYHSKFFPLEANSSEAYPCNNVKPCQNAEDILFYDCSDLNNHVDQNQVLTCKDSPAININHESGDIINANNSKIIENVLQDDTYNVIPSNKPVNNSTNHVDEKVENMVENCKLGGTSETTDLSGAYLSHIFLYPVKSCGAMSVKSWMIGPRGLLYDREWMIVSPSGVCLSQKQETKLCLIQPQINLMMGQMVLDFPGLNSISVSLELPAKHGSAYKEALMCQSKVCGDHVQCWDCGDKVAEWLSSALGRDGLRLIRQLDSDRRISRPKRMNDSIAGEKVPSLSLSNQAQFLLVNESSIKWLGEKLEEETDCCKEGLLERFRSNLTVTGFQPFDENDWSKVYISNTEFRVDGPCTRCQMICIDQATGERTREPLRTLAASFHGKMRFGIYLRHLGEDTKDIKISVGDKVVPFS
ncbi:molybdenum cofactor sulfurase 2 [Anabrus simplex]|uniref:molybdenum cofactor sulfurase 2 n=1 Tax=Anabrus simplex TaxID=316456 RepID=UPI0035A37C3F